MYNGWLVYNSSLQTEKFMDYARWFQKATKQLGMTMDLIPNCELLVTIMNGESQLNVPRQSTWPDFIHFADKDIHLAKQLEHEGIPLFNSSEAIARCDNKALMHHSLAGHNIPMPKTIISPKVFEGCEQGKLDYLHTVVETLGFPLIVKEAFGSFGQQVYKVDTIGTLMELVKTLSSKEFIFQEMITESTGRDIRLNVVGDQVITAMKRTSAVDFRANVTAGGSTTPYKPTLEEEELAIRTAKAIGADFAGVDLLLGQDGPLLCEINSNPHIRSIYECTGVDVAPAMVEHIKNRLT
ncbi:ATP-grasp domain-containing protein [Alteribacter populi]|uniref:ATP-grasp domain-containing protein n=1 Tax=Alteribacter populi TaxID=2011011 RepID=UPI0018E25265|nr:RimK family alpha-L-glutamate ligase [Alteribacter populi]